MRSKRSKTLQWKPTANGEIFNVVGIIIEMRLVRMLEVDSYWMLIWFTENIMAQAVCNQNLQKMERSARDIHRHCASCYEKTKQ